MKGRQVIRRYKAGERRFSRAKLRRAKLVGAILRNVDLSFANLEKADLRSANLTGANLTGCDLMEADLRDANLDDANLLGANLYEADVTSEQLAQAKSIKGAHHAPGRQTRVIRSRVEAACLETAWFTPHTPSVWQSSAYWPSKEQATRLRTRSLQCHRNRKRTQHLICPSSSSRGMYEIC